MLLISVTEFFVCDQFFAVFSLLKVSLRSSILFSSPISTFMTLTLNSFSRTLLLLISVSFSSLALFFHLDMALCPFCLCTSFYVLGMSAPFPLLENSGLLEKRLWCPEVQCPLFARTRWSRSFSYVCCVHPPAVAEMHFHSVHLAAMALFVFFGWGLVPVLCLRPSWT